MMELGLRSRLRRLSPGNLVKAYHAYRSDEVLFVDWVNRGRVRYNWGDAVAPVLVEFLSGKSVVNRRDVLNTSRQKVYSTIGSMLGTVDCAFWEVWGSGFVDSSTRLRTLPVRIHAVRGPLTRMRLLEQGVACPRVFGDPALLFPLVYDPEVEPRYELGVVGHYGERDLLAGLTLFDDSDIVPIDITGGIHKVVESLKQCRYIASSSLHGLVAAHAYSIPAIWVRLSDRPYGDGFKFRDHLQSVGVNGFEPLDITARTAREEVFERFERLTVEMDPTPLLRSCPFLREDLRGAGRPVVSISV